MFGAGEPSHCGAGSAGSDVGPLQRVGADHGGERGLRELRAVSSRIVAGLDRQPRLGDGFCPRIDDDDADVIRRDACQRLGSGSARAIASIAGGDMTVGSGPDRKRGDR
jgi:hypothetical protein